MSGPECSIMWAPRRHPKEANAARRLHKWLNQLTLPKHPRTRHDYAFLLRHLWRRNRPSRAYRGAMRILCYLTGC